MTIYSLTYSFPDFEPVCWSMYSSYNCFLICMQVFEEAGKVVWYPHPFKNFPQFVVIHTDKGFSIVNEQKSLIFWNSFTISMIQWMLVIWTLVPLHFQNTDCISGISWFIYCWNLAWRILSITFLTCKRITIVQQSEHSLALPFFEIGMKSDLFQSYYHCWVFKFDGILNSAH